MSDERKSGRGSHEWPSDEGEYSAMGLESLRHRDALYGGAISGVGRRV